MLRRLLDGLLVPVPHEPDSAWSRAEQLLYDSLTAEQFEVYRARGYVEVPSRLFGSRVYRIDGWRPVSVYEHGRFVGAVCIRPSENIPGPDVILARKLMIEGAEHEFLRSGNWLSPAWRPSGVTPTVLLLFVLLSPWLLHLSRLGSFGRAVGAAMLVVPGVVVWLRRRRRDDGNLVDPLA